MKVVTQRCTHVAATAQNCRRVPALITLHLLLFIAHKHNLNNQATSAVQDTELNSYRSYFVLTFLAGLHDKSSASKCSTYDQGHLIRGLYVAIFKTLSSK